MDENEAWWTDFWQRYEDRKLELFYEEGKSWEEAVEIARKEFELDD